MNKGTINVVTSPADAKALDDILWQILWQPLDLPRDVRQRFKVDGEQIELVYKAGGLTSGGLVAVWTGKDDVELRHIAVRAESQKRGVGRNLVEALIDRVVPMGATRIHTIARNTSTGFLTRLGFQTIPGIVPEHPDFKEHGIIFECMEKII